MTTQDINLPPLRRPQVPRIDADIDLADIRRLVDWCEKTARSYARAAIRAALQSQDHLNRQGRVMDKLFCDLKTDEEKAAFFLSGRGYETGVISQAIQNDVAMVYHRCVEYKKELEALQSKDRMKDQLNLVISKADKARAERTAEVVACITKARKDEAPDRSGFATEMADQYGFAFIDDDAEYMVCSTESLTDLMSALGFRTSEERHNVTIPTNTALTDEEIQSLWMNVATFDTHLADVLAISRAVERAVIEKMGARGAVTQWQPIDIAPQPAEPVRSEPVCYANINKQGDVTRTSKKRDGWAKTPLYLAPQPDAPTVNESLTVAEPVKMPSDEEVLKIAIDSGLAFRDSTGEVLCAWREDADISKYLVENARALLTRYGRSQ